MKKGSAIAMGEITGDYKTLPAVPEWNENPTPVISHGYFLLNQHKFFPRDSVKLKAYILDGMATAYTAPLNLFLIPDYAPNQKLFLGKIKPQTKGAYVFQFKLPDTLKIDNSYTLVFEEKGGLALQRARFKIEDYQLRNSNYSVQPEKYKYYLGEKLRFFLKATDANNLPLTDAKVRLVLKLNSYSKVHNKFFFVDNDWYLNMYQKELVLDVSEQNILEFPVSELPPLDMHVTAEVSFSNTAGELQSKTFSLEVSHNKEYYTLQYEQNKLLAHYFVNGELLAKKVVLHGLNNSKVLYTDTVELPFSGFIHQNCDAYDLKDLAGNRLHYINLPFQNFQGAITGERTHDSIRIISYNPNQFLFYYRIYKNDELVEYGSTRNLNYVKVDTSFASYNVIYSWVYRASVWQDEAVFTFKEKELSIHTNLPEQIFPGQTVPLDILVLNANRKPQADVNLTAFGINGQFEDAIPPFLPYYGSLKNKIYAAERTQMRVLPAFTEAKFIYNPNFALLLKTGIKQMGDYRLRYPNEMFFMHAQKLARVQSELVPFVVGNGKRVEVYYIEVNNIPVYVQNDKSATKSIPIQSGNNTIYLRTKSAAYIIPNITVQDSFKYVFSFDTLCLPNGIVKIPLSNQQGFSTKELAKMRSYLLQVSGLNSAYFQTDLDFAQHNIRAGFLHPKAFTYLPSASGAKKLFAFFVKDSIQVFYRGKPYQTFLFEPNRNYVFFNGKILPDETEDTVAFSFDFSFFKHNDEGFRSFFDTLSYYTYDPVSSTQNQMVHSITENPISDEGCLNNDKYLPSSTNDKLSSFGIRGAFMTQLKGMLFFHKTDVLKSKLNPSFDMYSHQSDIMLYSGLYDVYFISNWNRVYVLRDMLIKDNGISILSLDSVDFSQSCEVLKSVSTKSKLLHDAYKLRESVVKNFRKEDYVEVRENIPLQISASPENNPILSGSVFNKYDKVLPDVIVTLEQSGKVQGIAFTDATGGFLIRDIKAGTYQIRFTQYGSCITIVSNVQLNKNRLHHFSIRLQNCGFSIQANKSVPSVYFGASKMNELDKLRSSDKDAPYINGTGIIKGRVADANSKQSIHFVSISLVQNGRIIASTMSDDEGAFIFKNVAIGVYNLKSTYIGYSSSIIQNIQVEKDIVKFINFTLQAANGNSLQEVVVSNREQSIEPEGMARNVYAQKEQVMLSSRNVSAVNIRGGRADGAAYYVDGVKVQESIQNIPQNAIDKISIVSLSDKSTFENAQRTKLYQMAQKSGSQQERSVFRDYAFWVPNLVTNRFGEAHVSITFPDNITRWDNFFLAMNEQLDTRVHKQVTRSFKPLSAQLYIPSFALKGDAIYIKGKLTNYTGDTLFIRTRFIQKDSLIKADSSFIAASKSEQVLVQPVTLDTLAFSYQLKTDINYADGEKYLLPVFPNGIEQNLYDYFLLEGDTNLMFTTQAEGQYSLSIMNGITQILREEIERLQQYRYGCTEQTASKLIALLIEKNISRLVGDSFANEAMVKLCLARLESMQQKNGAYGWFNGSQTENWLTYYVLKSLIDASKMGYKSKAITKGIDFLKSQLTQFETEDKLRAIHLLVEQRVELDYTKLLADFREENLSLYQRLLLTYVKQKLGMPYFAGFLYEGVRRDAEGYIYWDVPYTNIYQNKLGFGILAYEVLRDAGADSSFLANLRRYYFDESNFAKLQKRNTLESALILQAMAKDIVKQDKVNLFPTLSLNQTPLGNRFPIKKKLENNRDYVLSKKGSKTWVYLHRKLFLAEPKVDSNFFKIRTSFWQQNATVKDLKMNEACRYEVSINNIKNQEFIMIQIPIPASCSYVTKGNSFGADEVEYHKDRIILFYRKFKAGNYQFNIPLEPRFAGSFTVLPVQIENMYNPTITGNAAKTELKIVP
ncbi:MAG: carboxypeptidase regulatory-like domain-containing protein [Bacteroidia bacterium]|nr:carboxypeptidase regulatory-like domain-containing protein [Bacteroidia bacterium]